MIKYILLTLIISISFDVNSQNAENFKEGIYLNFDQLKTNTPLPKEKIILYNADEVNSLRKAIGLTFINYKDENNVIHEIPSSSVWGFCENNAIYRVNDNTIYKIHFTGGSVGTCVPLGSISTVKRNVVNGLSEGVSYGIAGAAGGVVYRQNEIEKMKRKMIVDLEYGSMMQLNKYSLVDILERDADLLIEFVLLEEEEKDKHIFRLMEKYNSRHPFAFGVPSLKPPQRIRSVGTFEVEAGDISGLTITLTNDSTIIDTIQNKTAHLFLLDQNQKYKVVVSKVGYVTKTIEILTTNISVNNWENGIDVYTWEVKLQKQISGQIEEHSEPIGTIYYSPKIDNFTFKSNYPKRKTKAISSHSNN